MNATLGMYPAGMFLVATTASCLPWNTTVQLGAQEWFSKLANRYTPVPKCSGVEVLTNFGSILVSISALPFYLSDLKLNELTRILP